MNIPQKHQAGWHHRSVWKSVVDKISEIDACRRLAGSALAGLLRGGLAMSHNTKIHKRIIIGTASLPTKWLLLFLLQTHWLAGMVRAQQVQHEPSPPYLEVCSCVDLGLLSKEPLLILSCARQSLSPANVTKPRGRLNDISCSRDPECLWSKRFIETKARLQAAQSQQKTLQRWLFELQRGCGGDTYYDAFYFTYINGRIEASRTEVSSAEEALEQLREEFRRSGQPAAWERSELALQPLPLELRLPERHNQTKEYWQEQLSQIDHHYQRLVSPLQAELFELIHRRPANPGEDITVKGGLGICVPPLVYEIDKLIKNLMSDRERDRATLVEEAIHQGALPGWFR